MAIPILNNWRLYFDNPDEGLGSSYERVILNDFLLKIKRHFGISTVLEAPTFGFTGISGINSMELARAGAQIDLVDHNPERLELIEKTWQKIELKLNATYLKDYAKLPFSKHQFDLSWNFSALWFVDELENFLRELSRVTKKVILICVPNQTGIGFMSQKYFGEKDIREYLNIENINPDRFVNILKKSGWSLLNSDYIDCPPWPDIGMPKEKFLGKFGLDIDNKADIGNEPTTILNYYNESDKNFSEKMRQYFWFEKYAPDFIKKYWAHHKFFIFIK